MRNDGETGAANWKKGVLIINAFLKTDKFVEHYEWLKKAAKQYHIALSLLDNTALLYPVGGLNNGQKSWQVKGDETGTEYLQRDYTQEITMSDGNLYEDSMVSRVKQIAAENDFVLYWDKDILLGQILQTLCSERGVPVFNSVSAIGISDNKFETFSKIWAWNRMEHQEKKIPLPKTIAAPMTYENIGYPNFDFLDGIIESIGLPCVIKECYGSFGMQVYLAKNRKEVEEYTKKLAGKQFLYQEYLEESSGRDVRLQVVGDRVVAAMCRYSETGDFRANITNGGSMKRYEPSERECELAVRTVRALGLDFAGVDLLFSKGEQGEADVVCEVNSNAHFKNIFTCTGVNVAECIMEYIWRKVNG